MDEIRELITSEIEIQKLPKHTFETDHYQIYIAA